MDAAQLRPYLPDTDAQKFMEEWTWALQDHRNQGLPQGQTEKGRTWALSPLLFKILQLAQCHNLMDCKTSSTNEAEIVCYFSGGHNELRSWLTVEQKLDLTREQAHEYARQISGTRPGTIMLVDRDCARLFETRRGRTVPIGRHVYNIETECIDLVDVLLAQKAQAEEYQQTQV